MMRTREIWIYLCVAVLLLVGGAGVYIVQQNRFEMMEQAIRIASPEGELTGKLVLPKGSSVSSGKLGLVLFIHGDGPINASHDDGYKPLWERLASLGYASLSLDKRGIGGSAGHWLDQSIDDRVEEARAAIAWARKQPGIDPDRIGVWGASQAGWVIPKLADKEPLAFSILVSPAINWLRQGAYHTRQQMLKQGESEAEIAAEEAANNEVQQLLARKASYEDYLAAVKEDDPMTRERWTFVSKNYLSDAEQDLKQFRSPVLLLLGQQDIHVDWQETEQVYRKMILPGLLSVAVFPEAEHSMLSKKTADSSFRALMISLFAPRHITVPGYMNQIEDFLKELN
ncbi:alpha/beta hydrolase family protein [Paenibacillus sp. FSL H8-0048]|uniref:alpha/beta hydrolase family protein n=1 Tax=Paenibacillus sp. FSL H8-0048 TaxID=2954508 RepID=UPI004040AA56